MSITIRNLTDSSADIEAANGILVSAFSSPRSYRGDLHRYLGLQPDGFFLALWDGEPAGMGGAVDYGPFAYIGLVGVKPTVQRRGIGLAVMEHLLAWLDGCGCPAAVLDASEAGAPLYARLGFVETRKALDFRLDMPMPLASVPRPSSAVQPMSPSDVPEVADFDEPIFGARRDRVIAAYLADNPQRGYLVRDPMGHITGYLIAQKRTVGPWVAREPQAAAALFQAARHLPYADMIRVLVPSPNVDSARLLTANGFYRANNLSHMRRGGLPESDNRAMIYGQSSFALG